MWLSLCVFWTFIAWPFLIKHTHTHTHTHTTNKRKQKQKQNQNQKASFPLFIWVLKLSTFQRKASCLRSSFCFQSTLALQTLSRHAQRCMDKMSLLATVLLLSGFASGSVFIVALLLKFFYFAARRRKGAFTVAFFHPYWYPLALRLLIAQLTLCSVMTVVEVKGCCGVLSKQCKSASQKQSFTFILEMLVLHPQAFWAE